VAVYSSCSKLSVCSPETCCGDSSWLYLTGVSAPVHCLALLLRILDVKDCFLGRMPGFIFAPFRQIQQYIKLDSAPGSPDALSSSLRLLFDAKQSKLLLASLSKQSQCLECAWLVRK